MLDLIQQIRRDFDVSMLVVSHDLGVIRMLADRHDVWAVIRG